jgi:small-conductance mechanosensitive channel
MPHVDSRVLITFALLLLVLLFRRLTVRALGRSRLPIEVRARWLAQLRVALLVVLVVGLAGIWGSALRDVALSLAAVAVAFVVATREILACLTGAFVRTASRACAVGDRIEVQGVRGDVLELGALTTTLLEVTPGGARQTGRAVSVPNSRFLEGSVFNEGFTGEYGLQLLRVPLPIAGDWREAEGRLLEAAQHECADYLEPARRRTADQAWKLGLGPDTVEPTVSLSLPDAETIELQLRYPAPAAARARVEQAILRRYLVGGAAPDAMIDGDPQGQTPAT